MALQTASLLSVNVPATCFLSKEATFSASARPVRAAGVTSRMTVRCSAEEKPAVSSAAKSALVASLAALAIGQVSLSPAMAGEGPFAKQQDELNAKVEDYKKVPKEFSDQVAAKVGYGEGTKGERDDQVDALEKSSEGAFNFGAKPSKSGSTNFGQTDGDVEGKFGQNQ